MPRGWTRQSTSKGHCRALPLSPVTPRNWQPFPPLCQRPRKHQPLLQPDLRSFWLTVACSIANAAACEKQLHLHDNKMTNVAWRLHSAWHMASLPCRSTYIAAAACRFCHVTGLVSWHSSGREPCSLQDTTYLFGAESISSQLPG